MDKKGFSAREVRALLWLLPVLAVVSWLVWEISRPEIFRDEQVSAALHPDPNSSSTHRYAPHPDSSQVLHMPVPDEKSETAAETFVPQLFAFDPNTIEYHDLIRLGFERGEALGIVKYRERGKVFEISEDFAACYQVSEAMYRRLKPYIRIGEEFRLKPFAKSANISRQSGADVALTTGFGGKDSTPGTDSPMKQGSAAGAPLSRDERIHRSADTRAAEGPIELNTADSATLRLVRGIGEVTVGRIIEYRARLGGFAAVEQLAEVRGVTEQNYERMIGQIYVDPAVIQKIDINFAPAKTLAAHPYIKAEALRKLLKHRQLKGGWRTAGELGSDNIFTAEELAKLGPYLDFN